MKISIKTVILEESKELAEKLCAAIRRFEGDKRYEFDISVAENTEGFLQRDFGETDLVFISVEQPEGNGVELARRLRGSNASAILVLTARDEKAVLDGYTVFAAGYLIKDGDFSAFEGTMVEIMKQIRSNLIDRSLVVGMERSEWISFVDEAF